MDPKSSATLPFGVYFRLVDGIHLSRTDHVRSLDDACGVVVCQWAHQIKLGVLVLASLENHQKRGTCQKRRPFWRSPGHWEMGFFVFLALVPP